MCSRLWPPSESCLAMLLLCCRVADTLGVRAWQQCMAFPLLPHHRANPVHYMASSARPPACLPTLCRSALEKVQPRAVSYEEQVSAIREQLSALYEAQVGAGGGIVECCSCHAQQRSAEGWSPGCMAGAARIDMQPRPAMSIPPLGSLRAPHAH